MPSAVKRSSSHVEEAIIPGEFTKLILCFDGTGNTFSGTNADTNVVKILRKLDRNNNKQFHYYQTGIGTYDADETSIHKTPLGELKSKISKTIDQGFGTTFDTHIMAGYRFLMRYYEPDAKIYIFGFSRGAYTAKYLSRMVNKVGLLCKGNEEMVPFAYRLYARALQCESEDRIAAQKGKVWGMGVPDEPAKPEPPKPQPAQPERAPLLNGNGHANRTANGAPNGTHDYSDDTSDTEDSEEHAPPGAESESDSEEEEDKTTFMAGDARIRTRTKTVIAKREVKAFSRTFCRNEGTDPSKHKNIKVFFLGMWDCVNSVAVVEKSAPAPVEVTGTAKHVRHAVAVDERRVKFKPALLAQDIRTVVKEAKEKKAAMHTNGTPCKQGAKPKKEKTPEELAAEAEENKEDIREVWFPGNHGDIGGGWPAVPDLESPADMGWGKRLWYIFKTMKPADVTGGLKNNDLQMSDMALDWMIREVTLVGAEDPRCQVHWCHTLEKFTKAMDNKKKVEKDVVKGFMHDTLSFGYGSSFLKVFMWKFMEMLPGIPRWELNDKAKNEADKGWESYRFTPNFGSYRDIPRRAILHNSLKERLNADGLRYRPGNNHGHGDPCLIVGKTETAPMKVAENQNQKPLDQYHPKKEKKEKAWAERHQLWQLDNQ